MHTKIKTLLFTIFILVSCSDKTPKGSGATFLVTSNVRGQLDPCGWKSNPLGGLPRRATYISQVKQSGVDPILIDAGDSMFENYYFAKGKEESAKLRAKTVMKHTSNMGDYYYNVGVQDFTAGLDFIQEIERTTDVNFLSSNLYDKKTDNLLFNDHVILERNNIKIAIFGVTRELQVDMKGVRVEGYIDVAKIKIEELKPQVDILVMLVNATKKDYDPFLKDLSGVDYIFSSLEASKTRPGIQQVIGRPFEYQLGIQGKNIGRFDIYISEKGKPLQDVSSQMTMLNLYTQRLNKLQERDPKRKVEDIYKNSPNVLSTITKLKDGIKTSKETLKKAKNRSSFTMIPLSGSVASEKAILRDVDKVLERCKELDEESTLTS